MDDWGDSSGEIVKFIVAIQNGDLDSAAACAKKVLEKKENTTITIGITGESGSGKSSLVNALRGISDKDDAAAPVDVEETTMEPNKYSYPNNPNITIWDLPGIGTRNFPADQYLEKVGFEKFDFFIIVSDTRFRENDAKLALEIQRMKKKFYFIRSKIDHNIRDAERTQREFNKEQTLQKIRDGCIKNLKELKVQSPNVFLVSSAELHLYDFTLFYETLEKDLPEFQRDALLLALPNISLDIINKKKKELHKIILLMATTSAAVAGVPIPGLSVAIDIVLIVSFAVLCQKSFGLSIAALENLSRLSGVPLEELKKELKSPLAGIIITKELVIKVLKRSAKYIGSTALEEGSRFIPAVGTVMAMSLSFTSTYLALEYILNSLAEDAQAVFTRTLGK